MIDPESFLSSKPKQEDKLIDFEGSYSCPEQGCYLVTTTAKFDEDNRIVYWTCSNGHPGKASL